MEDRPYTTPEEDPFNVRPMQHPRRRRSSMLEKWIQEQQKVPSTPKPTPRASNGNNNALLPRVHPYLAYPDLGSTQESRSRSGSVITLGSYDLVDDADIPQGSIPEVPLTPTTSPSATHKGFLGTPTSFRSLPNPFRSQSPARSSTPTSAITPRTPSRKPFIPLNSRLSQSSGRTYPKQHNRSSSLSILNTSPPPPPPSSHHMPETTSTPSKWRPSVLGYFSASATSQVSFIPSETIYTPSRPSVSSNSTVTTATSITSATATAKNNDAYVTNSGVASFRLRRRSHRNLFHAANPNLVDNNIPSPSSAIPDPTNKSGNMRIPLAPKFTTRLTNSNVDPIHNERSFAPAPVARPSAKPEVAYVASSKTNTLSKMSFAALSSKNHKKKRLIISGIAPDDVRKFEGVKKWCENFGEVSHIIRMPNGDLHVHFKSADVADTVCRLRAKVYIVGCGSVGVSWATGSAKR
ncbi:hypothetical protein C8R42DRAFT_56208 [Lentinula raphanica]|nr:hypothetical protein C8R42DRAFT_56208 [Lentinula raphanica]